jgi:hypothetical protein
MPPVPDFVDSIPGNRHAFERLRQLLASGEAIAWVGAGASAGLYPLWGQLVGTLIDETARRGLASDEDRAYWRNLAGSRPQQVVRGIKDKLGDQTFRAILRDLFGRKLTADGRTFTATHAAIVRLPFRGIVTTNYDPCLLDARLDLRRDVRETGYATWKDQDPVWDWRRGALFGPGRLPILYAHGIHERSDTIVLGVNEYRDAYAPGAWRELFEQLWSTARLVCIGFGFSDPWLDFIADGVLPRLPAGEPPHIGLIGLEGDYSPEQRRLFHDAYGVEPLLYPVRPDHDPRPCSVSWRRCCRTTRARRSGFTSAPRRAGGTHRAVTT